MGHDDKESGGFPVNTGDLQLNDIFVAKMSYIQLVNDEGCFLLLGLKKASRDGMNYDDSNVYLFLVKDKVPTKEFKLHNDIKYFEKSFENLTG